MIRDAVLEVNSKFRFQFVRLRGPFKKLPAGDQLTVLFLASARPDISIYVAGDFFFLLLRVSIGHNFRHFYTFYFFHHNVSLPSRLTVYA